MRRVFLKNNVRIVAVRNIKNGNHIVDYYFQIPGRNDIYAFSRDYTYRTYQICKSGIRVNDLSTRRYGDKRLMQLIDYVNVMLPYLSDYYELPIAA